MRDVHDEEHLNMLYASKIRIEYVLVLETHCDGNCTESIPYNLKQGLLRYFTTTPQNNTKANDLNISLDHLQHVDTFLNEEDEHVLVIEKNISQSNNVLKKRIYESEDVFGIEMSLSSSGSSSSSEKETVEEKMLRLLDGLDDFHDLKLLILDDKGREKYYKTISLQMMKKPFVTYEQKTKEDVVNEIIRSHIYTPLVETVSNTNEKMDSLTLNTDSSLIKKKSMDSLLSSEILQQRSRQVEKEWELKKDMESALLLHGSDEDLTHMKEALKVRGENVGSALGTVLGNDMPMEDSEDVSKDKSEDVSEDKSEDVSEDLRVGGTGMTGAEEEEEDSAVVKRNEKRLV
jgi:hypothetical protein